MPSTAPTQKEPPFDLIVDFYLQGLADLMPDFDERAYRTMLADVRTQTDQDDDVLSYLEMLHQEIGHPREYFDHMYDHDAKSSSVAEKAAQPVLVEAIGANQSAALDVTNACSSAEAEAQSPLQQPQTSQLTALNDYRLLLPPEEIAVGDFVSVLEDLSVGHLSHGGKGWVTNVSGDDDHLTCTVEYVTGSIGGEPLVETDIPRRRIAIVSNPVENSTKRRRTSHTTMAEIVDYEENNTPGGCTPTLKEALLKGFADNRAKGWRAKDLEVVESTKSIRDAKLMLDVVEFCRLISGRDKKKTHEERNITGRFKKRDHKYDPMTWEYLAYAWDVTSRTLRSKSKLAATTEKKLVAINPTRQSVIESVEAAKIAYSPAKLFIEERVISKMQTEAADGKQQAEREYQYRLEGKGEWLLLSADKKKLYEIKHRSKVAEQPYIRDRILESMRQIPFKSFLMVAADIGQWCSPSTIKRWLASHEKTAFYVERILPLLSTEQRRKHLQFAEHLRNRWGLPAAKYLWIHFDEKWFVEFVGRTNSKKCELLGIDENFYFAYHKKHINKVIVVAAVGYAFDGNIENGGDGLKLGLFRCQGPRLQKEQVPESRNNENGQTVCGGDVECEQGDVNMVVANDTSSHKVMPGRLKFFRETLFPHVTELTAQGSRYEGYIPVWQGDNASPHNDATFEAFVKAECQSRGWHWEPQAPNMPHLNVLDLAVFPPMSKTHGDLVRQFSKSVVPMDEIWKAAENAWTFLSPAAIARSFVLANKISKTVVEKKGCNSFLSKQGGLLDEILEEFDETPTGIVPKQSS